MLRRRNRIPLVELEKVRGWGKAVLQRAGPLWQSRARLTRNFVLHRLRWARGEKTRISLDSVLALFRAFDFPMLIVSREGLILAASKGTSSIVPDFGDDLEGQVLGDLLQERPEPFSAWLDEARLIKTVRFREQIEEEAPDILVTAQPLQETAWAAGPWVLTLRRKDNFFRQKYEREILLRIASVPIPEMTEEGYPLTGSEADRCPITRDLLTMISQYLTADCALILRRGPQGDLEPIGQCGISRETLTAVAERLKRRESTGESAEDVLGSAAGDGLVYVLSPINLPDKVLGEVISCLPVPCREIWVDGISGFGVVLTFFSRLPSRVTRQFATDAFLRLGRHLESATYSNTMYETYLKLQETQEQMIQSSKMAAIGELATGMAHELRQPVTAINNFLSNVFDFLESGRFEKLAERLEEYRERSFRNVNRLMRIIDHLRTFGRQDTAQFQATEIRPFLEEIFQTFLHAQLVHLNIQVCWEVPWDLPPVEIDPPRIEQVFLNLIANARDALEHTPNPIIIITAGLRGDRLVLAVSDNGPGIPEANLDKVLNPFFTTKEVGKGTGVGLSVSHGIIKGHHGSLEIKNCPEGGASFIIELPLKQPAHTGDGIPAGKSGIIVGGRD